MKALTVNQPWASLIVDGRKPWETRSWFTPYRGPLAIHAGLKVDRESCRGFGYNPDTIPRGCVLGIVDLARCLRLPHPDVVPDEFGDYAEGRFAWRVFPWRFFPWRVFDNPVPARGSLGIWNWHPPSGVLASDEDV
jgi:activating signal cointegrator 1